MSANRYLPAARIVAQTILGILAQHRLNPLIRRFVLTETERGAAWLFVVLDISPMKNLEAYAASDVLDHLSTEFHGHPVVINNSDDPRYAVLLSSLPNLLKTPPAH